MPHLGFEPLESLEMATGLRHKRWAALAVASLSLLAACGEKEEPVQPQDAGSDADASPPDVLLASLAADVAGSPCTNDADCEGTNARCTPGAPGAVRSCTGRCTSDEHCGENGTCLEVARLGTATVSFCQKLCSSHDECDSALQCNRAFNLSAVLLDFSNLLSGADVLSDERTTICQEKPDTAMIDDGAVGRACSEGCPGGTCNAFPSPLTPGGYCTGKCLEDEQCGENGACVRDVATRTLGLPGMCLLRCTEHSECRQSDGYGCYPLLWVLPDMRKYCVPDEFLRDGPPRFRPVEADAGSQD
jgi:hypothetical protein